MSEQDKAAIEIVRNLSKNVRAWAIAIMGIFTIAIFSAIFWGGATDNQVKNNTNTGRTNREDIEELTKIVREFVTEQKVANESYATKDQLLGFTDVMQESALNYAHISWWAERQGYRPLPRSEKTDTNNND